MNSDKTNYGFILLKILKSFDIFAFNTCRIKSPLHILQFFGYAEENY